MPGFELVEELGRGTTTAVFRARHDGGEYAVKIHELSGPDDPARITFRREAAILAAISHPCLAKVYEVGDDGRICYLAMELIGGRTLAEVIGSEGAMSEARALSIAADLASALDAAHRVGLVHRDVAPRNVVFRADGRPVLIDFGLATQTGTHQPEDSVVGTVMYSAPEQTGMIHRPVDRRSDLYSLGGVLFECVTGRPPFVADEAGEVVRLHAVARPPDVRSLQPAISVQLSRIIARLLAKDPDDRYRDAASLLADLEALRRGTLAESAPLGRAIGDQSAGYAALVGRDAAVASLVEVVDESRACGAGAAVLVESEPGGGKTNVVTRLAAIARSRHMTVLEAQLGPDHLVPLGPLTRAVGRFLADLEARDPGEVVRYRSESGLKRAGTADSLIGLSIELDRFLSVDNIREPGRGFHEFAVIEAAHLLMAIANASSEGALLVIDNAHLADDATHRVLAYLAPELRRLRLVIVLTSRTDRASTPAMMRLRGEMGESVRERIELSPLSDADIGAILEWQLGGDTLEPGLANEITIRASGNPAAAIEYLRSALEAGVLRPSWGTFSVDAGALASLNLETDVLGLALRRLEAVRPATRWLLAEAAVIGTTFHADLLATITAWPIDDVHVALGEASTARVVEGHGSNRYVFLHEGVQDALLASLDESAARSAHDMLARALSGSGDNGPEVVYEIARHFSLGEVSADADRAFAANHRAARLALKAEADGDARGFLATATLIASGYGLPTDSSFEADCGIALSRDGQITLALQHFDTALALEHDPYELARIHEHIARVHYVQSSGALCLEHARRGLSELRKGLPSIGIVLAVTTPPTTLAGVSVSLTHIGFGRATGRTRERLQLQCRLLEIAGSAADLEHRPGLLLAIALRSLFPAGRLGYSREYVDACSRLGLVLAQIRLSTAARWLARRANRIAEKTGDHGTAVHAELVEAISLEFQGESVRSERQLTEVLRHESRFLQPGEYLNGVIAVCTGLGLRGRILEQVTWLEEAAGHTAPLDRAGEGGVTQLDYIGIAIAGLLEHPSIGIERVKRVSRRLDLLLPSRVALAGYQVALANFHFGLGDLGEPFEDAISSFRAMKLRPWDCPYALSSFWIVQAYGRIAQAVASGAGGRSKAVRSARKAVRALRIAARTPLLRAHYYAARTGYLVARRRYKAALRASAKGQALLVGLDGPGVEIAIQMARSRALAGVGYDKEAERMAVSTARLAEDLSLSAFARWIHPLMPIASRPRYSSSADGGGTIDPGQSLGAANEGSDGLRDRAPSGTGPHGSAAHRPVGHRPVGHRPVGSRAARQLEALLQVGAAASRVLDPEELARLALDETIRILNAERGLLFLTDEASGSVRPRLGRDANCRDLAELTRYSSTIVDRVVATREPMVLTGTEQGAALGSESAVSHGLRSILVAPLQIDERLLGVVYLDSRLAKGIFTRDDVEILSAITSNVAFALETARVAEMELSVASERRQRQVAELLRDSMRTVVQSLEPRGVLRAILETSVSALDADAGAILLADGELLEVVAAVGGDAMPPEGYNITKADEPDIAEALRSRQSLSVSSVMSDRPSPLDGLLGRSGSFIVTPLAVRENAIGAIVVVAPRPNAFGQTQTEIAHALANQGVVAYENAQLFARLRVLAQRDELSGVANRRYFFELASDRVTDARQAGHSLSAMMIDIDHFKDVNDQHGHSSGDDVIRMVGQWIAGAIGSGDVVGRYGGEEFAVVVQAPLAHAAEVAELIRQGISENSVATSSGPITVTVSVGIAQLADFDADIERLLQRTDAALYEAKRAGRNRVVVAT